MIDLDEGTELARQWARHAVTLDPSLAEAWALLAMLRGVYDWDWAGSREMSEQALKVGPNNPEALAEAGRIEQTLGHFALAQDYQSRALEHDPLSQRRLRQAAFGYWFDRNFKKAEELFRRNGELHRNPELDFDLARALLLQGRYDEALSMIEVHQEFGDHQNLIRAFVYHSVGRHKEAAESLRSIIDHQGIPLGFQIAEMYAWQGKPDEAFEWLEISFNNRDGGMTYLIIDPFLDSLHDDPRWRPLVERMNLLEYWDALPAR